VSKPGCNGRRCNGTGNPDGCTAHFCLSGLAEDERRRAVLASVGLYEGSPLLAQVRRESAPREKEGDETP
jgi:hypothetical protein